MGDDKKQFSGGYLFACQAVVFAVKVLALSVVLALALEVVR